MPTVDFKDYYKTLGVSKDADEKALRAAFRKLARELHPDVNPGDHTAEERFKEVNEAYEVLSDDDKRKLYDRFGEDWRRYQEAGYTGDEPQGRGRADDFGTWYTGQGGGGQQWTSYGGDDGFSDFFSTLFGSSPGSSRRTSYTRRAATPARGNDLEAAMDITFDEAFKGTSRRFDLQSEETCQTCGGTGESRNRICPTCQGSGATLRTRTIEVKVPAGVRTGSKVRVAGQGGSGRNGGPNGDVYLHVTVLPDRRFNRDGDNLSTNVDVPLYTAVLGGESIVTTPTGKVALTIPPGTPAGKTFRLRGKGMPKLKNGGNGDLLAAVNVILPSSLTDEEKHLFEQLRDLETGGQNE